MRLDENNLRLDTAAGKELRRKVNFTTAGHDPCLADGFIMKTLVPDEEKLNDVSPPDSDDDSVDTEIGTPELIEKVPDLPKSYDEAILNHPTEEEEPSEMLKGKRGRRKKKDTFQGNHWSDRSSIPIRKVRDYDVMRICGRPLIPLSQNSIKRLIDEFEVAVPSRKKRKSKGPHQKVRGARLTSLLWLTHCQGISLQGNGLLKTKTT